MRLSRLRDILPKGLYWRSLLIIVAPVALMQLVITIVFLDDHWRATSKRMGQGVAADVGLLIQLYERDPTPERLADMQRLAKSPLRLDVTLERGGRLEQRPCFPIRTIVDRYMESALESELRRPIFYDASCPGPQVEIRIPIAEGVLSVRAFRERVQARSGPWFVMWIFGATLMLTAVSVVFIRNQVRPIERLAAAMNKFGRGIDSDYVRPRGAREVREAASAFLDMQRRIRRHIDQRAQLLAGVSHDLRTPLTRLKLQFALMKPSEELAAAAADLADMENTLEEYLAFARGEWAEDPDSTDIRPLVSEAARAAGRGGARIDLNMDEKLVANVRAGALKRALANLIDNAAAHGEQVRIEARKVGSGLAITVDDDGPGIAPDLYEDAFRPFSSLDETRTRNPKGVGLGLAIARDVARGHGGDVVLSPSPLGGLRATLRLPAARSERAA